MAGEQMVCRQCGRVLDSYPDGSWEHPLGDPEPFDHKADPVPEGTVPMRGRCDFCFAKDPAFILPARDFQLGPVQGSRGDWSACAACGALLERNQWNGVLRRSVESWEARHGPMPAEVRASLSRMHRLLRKHVTGAVRPI